MLIKCCVCNGNVSVNAKSCPICGEPDFISAEIKILLKEEAKILREKEELRQKEQQRIEELRQKEQQRKSIAEREKKLKLGNKKILKYYKMLEIELL